MKKLTKFLLIILIIPCVFILNACSFSENTKVYVTDIVQTETVGNLTTYTVYYSNGQTSLLTVKNGENGENGENLTIESIKAYCEANGEDFDLFLEKFLTIVQEQKTVKDATNIAIHSAVTVWSEFPAGDYHNKDILSACGAGTIYKMDDDYSYILTNYHVVYYVESKFVSYPARRVHIFQYGSKEEAYTTNQVDEDGYPILEYGYGAVEAEYIGGSLNYDIAVLKVKTDDLKQFNEHARAATIADEYELGETAIAIGNPEREGFSVTSGIISVYSEEIPVLVSEVMTEGYKVVCNYRVMRIDTAINGGNSGGGLYNIDGEFIGIVNAKDVANDIDNIAYAIPFDNAVAVAENIIYHSTANTPANVKMLDLGITFTTENNRAVYNPTTNKLSTVEDVVIESVKYNSGKGVGFTMGLSAGDVIQTISIDGTVHTINRAYQIDDLMLTIREGDKIIVTVKRNGLTHEGGVATISGILSSQLIVVA